MFRTNKTLCLATVERNALAQICMCMCNSRVSRPPKCRLGGADDGPATGSPISTVSIHNGALALLDDVGGTAKKSSKFGGAVPLICGE